MFIRRLISSRMSFVFVTVTPRYLNFSTISNDKFSITIHLILSNKHTVYRWNFSYRTIMYLWMWRWVSSFCKPVQTCSRCYCRCHCRSQTQCRYVNYKCKWGLSVKWWKQYEWLQIAQWSYPQVQQYRSQRSAMCSEALVYMLLQIIHFKWQNEIWW